MSVAPVPRPAFQGPRHLVGGGWRRALEVVTVVGAVSPLIVWTLLLAWAWSTRSLVVLGVVSFEVPVLFLLWSPGRFYLRWSYWRARWWWDGRAAGLALNAEHSLTGSDTGTVDVSHHVVVPWVHRLVLLPNGRRYVLRPLPGQSIDDYQAAVPRLVQRFAAVSVTVAQVPGSRYIAVTIADDLPRITTYSKAA